MVFYFSATGNSKYVAKRISEEFSESMVSIPEALKENKLEYTLKDEEKVFFIFPIYFYGLPTVVAEFIEKVNFTGNEPEICAISTCGGGPGGADKIFRKLFKEKDIEIKAFFKIKMVDNYVMMFKMPLMEEQIMVLRRSEEELHDIIDSIKFNYRVSYKSPIGYKLLSKIAYSFYKDKRGTKKFIASESCNGCGLCERICPAEAILIKDGKPTWVKEQCIHCCGCINRCPAHAIEYGKSTKKRGQYVNPNIEM